MVRIYALTCISDGIPSNKILEAFLLARVVLSCSFLAWHFCPWSLPNPSKRLSLKTRQILFGTPVSPFHIRHGLCSPHLLGLVQEKVAGGQWQMREGDVCLVHKGLTGLLTFDLLMPGSRRLLSCQGPQCSLQKSRAGRIRLGHRGTEVRHVGTVSAKWVGSIGQWTLSIGYFGLLWYWVELYSSHGPGH